MIEEETILDARRLGARVTYRPRYPARDDADAMLAWALASASWQIEAPLIRGTPRPARRRRTLHAPGDGNKGRFFLVPSV